MALVCDIKSDQPSPPHEPPPKEDPAPVQSNEDLEDGEIEDDDEEPQLEPETPQSTEATPQTSPPNNKFPRARFDRPDRPNRYEDRKRGHLTEAEKSVLHLHKLERFEREKRDRYKVRDQPATIDDFASNIEKAIANELRKEQKRSDEDEKVEEDKRGKKRKKKDKEKRRQKQRRGSLKPDGTDDPVSIKDSPPHGDSYDSATSSEGKRKSKRADKKFKGREQKSESQSKENQGICIFYLQGKCTKDTECPFSHEISQPLKLELCKFYLMGCCAKGEKCFYMHSEFPCKFYHTGLPCYAGDSCKFSHGKPLEEGLRQILFKHIETAPKEILGEFPRLSRDGALTMINQAQKALESKYDEEKDDDEDPNSIPSLFELNIPVPELLKDDEKSDKPTSRERNRPSRWQDPDPVDADSSNVPMNLFGIKGFYSERGDQDMRVNSSGDIDMRTLPPQLSSQPILQSLQDVDIRQIQDTDIRQLNMEPQMDFTKDVDIRQMSQFEMASSNTNDNNGNTTDEPNLQIIEEGNDEKTDLTSNVELPDTLPKKQRELFLRIRAQQKENIPTITKEVDDDEPNNIDWYSDDDDDDDDNRLTIGDDIDEAKPKSEEIIEPSIVQPSLIKPVEVIEKLGDLSKIDISAEVTKMLLSTISQTGILAKNVTISPKESPKASTAAVSDPRRSRVSSTETKKPEKLSIYDQGSISLDNSKDIDLRNVEDTDLRPQFGDTDLRASTRPDIDLRQLALPFKAMQNYTPASEIDASINSRTPIVWRVHLVDIPKPDYTGLKLTPHEAQNTGDPRLRKIFRLNSTEEKDSPASPKESPKAVAAVRNDPRRRKLDEKPPSVDVNAMNYSQQLNTLQSSAFYQSLTSNQKVLLNQELASKYDHSGSNDPTLNGILSNLGLLSNTSAVVSNSNATANTSALNILANINNMNPMMQPSNIMVPPNQPPPFVNQMPPNQNVSQSMVQPGLLGTAPGVPNLPPDFQLNFDPRQGGLLGNAPNYNNYNDNSNFNNFNDNYYEDGNYVENNGPPVGRGRGGNRGGFRGGDRQQQSRRGRNFSRNNVRHFRGRNRSNRSRTPP